MDKKFSRSTYILVRLPPKFFIRLASGQFLEAPTSMKLKISDSLATQIRKLHPQLRQKIRDALDLILEDPSSGKALKEDLAGLWSFRVSRFRIIYRLGNQNVVELVAVGPRRFIYEETFRLIQKKN